MEWRCCGGQGACCSVTLIGTLEPRCYLTRGITAMSLLLPNWSDCVNLFARIGPRRQKTKSMFRSRAGFNFQSRCLQMSFLSSEASTINSSARWRRERMCSALSPWKGKVPGVASLSPLCVTVHADSFEDALHRKRNARPCVLSPSKAVPFSRWLMMNHTGASWNWGLDGAFSCSCINTNPLVDMLMNG